MIGVLPGDGIGPIIMKQALRVLRELLAPELKQGRVEIREIEGEYIWGNKGIQVNEDLAVDFKVQTRQGSERIARAAFEYAGKNGKKNVTIVTKANIGNHYVMFEAIHGTAPFLINHGQGS